MAYRRRKGTDMWHHCRNCSQWPVSNFDEQSEKPAEGLCPECTNKEKEGRCQN